MLSGPLKARDTRNPGGAAVTGCLKEPINVTVRGKESRESVWEGIELPDVKMSVKMRWSVV